jgi:SulP family sulfate permease
MVLAAFLFMRQMAKSSKVESISGQMADEEDKEDPLSVEKLRIPHGVQIYEINGPLFFGAASQFKETMKILEEHPRILILRMRYVPFIDATGINNLREVVNDFSSKNSKVILSGVSPSLMEELEKARIVFQVGKKNICTDIKSALIRADELLNLKMGK